MLCRSVLVLFVTIATFADSVWSVGVDWKKQSKECINEETVMEIISQKVSVLEKDLKLLKEQLESQIMMNRNHEQRINDLYEKLATVSRKGSHTGKTEDPESLLNITRYNADLISKHVENYRVKRQGSENVAFSAYVDHEVLSMGKDQIVQFQNVLLNDGNGYNKFTGIFTVPRSGVYMLIFFVEDYHRFQSIFHIVVNKNIVTSAIADPLPEGQNVQGGNVVLVHLNAGESVWVSVGVAGDDIEGYSTLRTSTFSGYLVYE